MFSSLNCKTITKSKATGSCFKKNAFTIIEVLVVVAIIGLLASIILVSIKGVRERAKIAAGLNFAAQVHHALGAYAIGIWDFDEVVDNTCRPEEPYNDICDSSGNNNHGERNGAGWTAEGDTPSGKGYALEFDGSNDYVNCDSDSSLDITEDITITAWIYIKNYQAGAYIVAKRDGSNRQYALFHNASGALQFYTWGADDFISTTDTIPLNSWHHVVATFASGVGELYIDGFPKATDKTAGAITTATSNVFIGARGNGAGGSIYNFSGLIDEVHIYEEALTSAQIKKLYAERTKKRGLLSEKFDLKIYAYLQYYSTKKENKAK